MRQRDEEFRRFVAERSAALLRLAYLLCTDKALAEDVLQNALVKGYLRWSRIASNPEAYLRRVIVTVAADERRRPWRRELPAAEVPDGPDPAEPYSAVEVRGQLLAALSALPPRQRAAVVLRHWVGLDPDSVAQMLGCSPGTLNDR
ncbi:MAG TPA: SigE family RNA polymerase sigma factor [Candidatus Limnocylindrales bacterium]|nr:SigE family RNA polymerase sigma factor [Candidatus Limnocylindrales bacterium]